MNIVIFSKNRPAQLDLFLSSMGFHFPEVFGKRPIVFYKADDDFIEGYDLCREYHPWAFFIIENDFKKQVISIVDIHKRTTMFAVDDIVWKNKFSMNDREYLAFIRASDQSALSLRLWPGINWSYMANCEAKRPRFVSRFVWQPRSGSADWNYPMSLDCNIYKTLDILPLLKALDYNSPNSLEGQLSYHPIGKKYQQCFPESRIMNIPANRVQTECIKNRSMSGDYQELNDVFMGGNRLNFNPYIGYRNNSVHFPMGLEWRR
jgi:hypothetical protein